MASLTDRYHVLAYTRGEAVIHCLGRYRIDPLTGKTQITPLPIVVDDLARKQLHRVMRREDQGWERFMIRERAQPIPVESLTRACRFKMLNIIARIVDEEVIASGIWAHKPERTGECNAMSAILAVVFHKLYIPFEVVEGWVTGQYHSWVRVNDVYIDIAGAQFGLEPVRVFFMELEQRYRPYSAGRDNQLSAAVIAEYAPLVARSVSRCIGALSLQQHHYC